MHKRFRRFAGGASRINPALVPAIPALAAILGLLAIVIFAGR